MKYNRRFMSFFSIWMIVALLLPNVAQAAMPLQPRPALSESFQAGGLAEPMVSIPLGLHPEAAAGSTTSAPVETPAGRLLFAPAVDADGDPASNPVIGVPAPVIDLAGEIGGVVVLAAQLAPDAAAATPIGVPVTFRVWDAAGVQFEQTVRSDAWGAASAQVILRAVDVEYSYQASAPGYGETEVRRFRFDPAQAAYRLHLDGAQLWYWEAGPGQVRLTLRSPVPLDAARDAVTLQIARRPADAAAWDVESPLQPLIAAIGEAGLGLPFPEVAMQVVGTYTATALVQLPPGDYGFIGAVAVNTTQAEHFFSQPLQLEVAQGARNQPEAAIWASPLEHEPGRTLVQYAAPSGQASFDLVDTAQLPEISDDWEGENLFVKAWRTGPFTWQEEQYQVTVETIVDDGKKVASLAGFDYDPLLRRYTLAIKSLQAQTVTDTLRVDVFGPGGVVIHHEEAQVVLEAGRVLHYSIEVPAELGQPEGLRVELEDPLMGYVNGLVAAAKKVVSAVQSHGSVTFQVKAYAKVLGIELLSYTSGGGGWKWGTNLDALKTALWDLVYSAAGGSLALGTVGVEETVSLTASFSVDKGQCPSDEGVAQVKARLQALAGDLNSMAGKLPWGKSIDAPSIPVWGILQAWISGSGGVKATISASGLTLKVGGQAYVDIAGNVGIKFTFWGSGAKAAWWIIKAHWTLADIILMAAVLEDWKVKQKPDDECDPEPPDERPPDDRQDVWQGLTGFYKGRTDDVTIDNLNDLIARAQAQSLWRAERLLTLRLRETELARFNSDMAALSGYLDEVDGIAQAADVDLQGLISGTLPISPSATLTEALVTRMEQATTAMEALPYAQDQQLLLDAVAVAERLYLDLHGAELELQQELRQLLTAGAVGVLASGFAHATLSVLEAAGLPSQLVSPWPSGGEFRGQPAPYFAPALAPRVLVVPSGGLHAIAGSPEAREWLDEYVAGGGLLIVFTQAYGADWAALPGGEVTGVGYEEDQRCQHDSVRAVGRSNWLVWMGRETPDIQVDGAFTAWPGDTQVLLTRTRGRYAGYPAMIEYAYGDGQVLATSAYGDWAWQASFWWGDEWQMTRSVLIRAWLLARGQDVDVAFAADPASTVEVSFPFTNTGAFTTTAIKVILPVRLGWWGSDYADTVPLAIAPGESGLVTATLSTPPVRRGVHNWTQVGLYHLKVTVSAAGGGGYRTWGPFVHVHSPVILPELALSLHTRAWASLFETVPVTATVENHTDVTHTVVLRDQQDLPTAPVTLTVPPLGRAEHIYNLRIDSSKNPAVVLYNESNKVIDRARAVINVAYPQLQTIPIIPTAIANGAAISLVVTNQPRPRQPHIGSALVGSVALTLTAPSGAAVWTATQALPPLAVGEVVTPAFTMNDLAILEYGTYRLWYRVDDGRLSQTTSVPLPARADVKMDVDRSFYRIRESLTLTVQSRNTGRFDLAPRLELSAPDAGWSYTQPLTLPVGMAWGSGVYTFTLPDSVVAGDHAVYATWNLSDTITRTASFYVLPAAVQVQANAGPYTAGYSLPVTLTNPGGVDAVVAYTLALQDAFGAEISLGQDLTGVLVQADQAVVITGSLPLTLASGGYRLNVTAQYTPGCRPANLLQWVTISGADVQAQVAHGPHLAGGTVPVALINHGSVDAVVTYTLALRDHEVELFLGQDLSGTLVPAHTTVIVTGTIPQGTRSGGHNLCVNGVYTPGARPVVDPCHLVLVSGPVITLTGRTDRELYLTADTITVTARLTNTGTLLPESDLGLTILKEGGSQWQVYNTGNSGLSSNYLRTVGINENGVWLGSDDEGYCDYDFWEEEFAHAGRWEGGIWYEEWPPAQPEHINAIAVGPDNRKWFATNKGAARLSADNMTWHTYRTFNSDLVSDAVNAVAVYSDSVWLGTAAGVALLENDSDWTIYDTGNSGLVANNINAVAVYTDGAAWFGTTGGLNKLTSGGTWYTYTTANSALLHNNVTDIAIDNAGNVWLATPGTGGGVSVLQVDGSTWVTYTTSNSDLVSAQVSAIAAFTDGRKWIGYASDGVSVIAADDSTWNHYTIWDLSDPCVSDIAAAANGDVWLATGYGLTISNTNWSMWDHQDALSEQFPEVNVVAVDADGYIWIDGIGLEPVIVDFLYSGPRVDHLQSDMTTWDYDVLPYPYELEGSGQCMDWREMSVNAIAGDGGRVWVATTLGAVVKEAGSWTNYTPHNSGLAAEMIYAVAVAYNSDAWFGTDQGVFLRKYFGGSWTHYHTGNSSLVSNEVYAVAAHNSSNEYWFGTDVGLSRLNIMEPQHASVTSHKPTADTWYTYTTANSGLLRNNIADIAIDHSGNVWLSTPGTGGGVSVLDPGGESPTWVTYTTSNSDLKNSDVRSIAVDDAGRKWIGYADDGVSVVSADKATWRYYTGSMFSSDKIRDIASASNGNVWLATWKMMPATGGATRYKGGVEADDEILWTRAVTLSLGSPDVFTDVAALTAASLGTTGRLALHAVLTSTTGQVVARDRYPFYIFATEVGLELTADREVYHPGQTLVATGALINNSALTLHNQKVSVDLNGVTIYTTASPFDLLPGASYHYTATGSVPLNEGPVLLEAFSPQVNVGQIVQVSAPTGAAVLEAPDIAGRAPFSVTVVVTNTGESDAIVQVSIAGQEPEWLALAPGQFGALAGSVTITADTTITATVRGDLEFDLAHAVAWGEAAALTLLPPDTDVSGLLQVPYVLYGTGELSTSVQLHYHLAAGSVFSASHILWPGQTLSATCMLDVPGGRHTLFAELRDQDGRLLDQDTLSLTLAAQGAPLEPEIRLLNVTITPEPVAAGDVFSVALELSNTGPSGPVVVGLQVFDPLQQWIITPTGWLTQTYSFTLAVPADMPAGSCVGEVSVDGQSQPFTLDVTGVDVALGIALDRPWYLPGDMISLTATLTESAGLSGTYNLSLRYLGAEDYVTVTVPSGAVVQYAFNFTATEAGRASVTLAYTPSEHGQRIIMIDSLPATVVDPSRGAYLTPDRTIYDAGDTLYLTATITGTLGNVIVMGPMELMLRDADFLMWQAPAAEDGLGLVLTGAYPLSYTFPVELRSGRYTFLVQADGQQYAYAVDVRGWSVTSRRVTLDKLRYAPQDELAATVELFNEGEAHIEGLRLSAWIAPPGGERGLLLTPAVSRTVDLQPGLNVFTVTGAFSTALVGPHRLVVNVGPGCCGWRVAGASAQFDVGWAHLVELTTDHGNYTPGESGLGQLDVYGYGPTHLVVTATNGSTLLDQTPDLAGYGTLTFTIPTTPTGDYLLVAHSSDQNDNTDNLIRAYAVPGPRDTQLPALTLTYPSTDTVITTAAPTTTITVQGNASDDSGQVTVLVNGEVVTPTAGGDFSLLLEVHQGFNMVSVTALDAAGNSTYLPIVPVYLLPARTVTLSADRTEAAAGERVTFQAVLASSGALSAVLLQQSLPSTVVTDVVASASSGEVSVGGLSPAWHVVEWQGNLDDTQPVTVTVAGTLITTSPLTQTVTAYWGWGFSEVSNAVTINAGEVPVEERLYLPLVLHNYQSVYVPDLAEEHPDAHLLPEPQQNNEGGR